MGFRPAPTRTDAARMPAGPPPTITTLRMGLGLLEIGPYDHAVGCESRAGPHALAVSECDPTILTSSHETEAGTRCATEFETANSSSVQQKNRKQAVAFDRLDHFSVDCQTQRCALAGDSPHELPLMHPLLWLVWHSVPPRFY